MKLILTGATGFAGGEVLKQALADPAIERVTVLTRRPLGVTHAKLSEVIVRDFLDYTALRFDAGACIWRLGVSQSQLARCLIGVAKNGSDNRLLDNRAIVVWPAWTPR